MRWKSAARVAFSMMIWSGSGGLVNLMAQSPSPGDFRILFPHYAAGRGFATVFTFMNSGATAAEGFVTLHDSNGNPRTPVQVRIPPQGISSFAVWRTSAASPISGWAKYEGSGGEVTGVATYQLTDVTAKLVSVAGVPSSQLVQQIRIPVEISSESGSYPGYAVANPGHATISVSISVFDQDGEPLGEISRLTLPPGRQMARFLHEDMPGVEDLFGSVVISSQDGPFIAVSLAQVQGLYTAVPSVSRSIP